jgi:ribosomal protein L40E
MSITPEPNRPPQTSQESAANICPECQAVNPRRAATCWLCYGSLRPGTTGIGLSTKPGRCGQHA